MSNETSNLNIIMETTRPNSQKSDEPAPRVSSSSSNQLFVAESLDLPDDSFRMSLDSYSVVGENVTIGDRNSSIDIEPTGMVNETPASTPAVESAGTQIVDPFSPPPETPIADPCTPPPEPSPTIVETPKIKDEQDKIQKTQNLLKLSLIKNTDDVFVKPSPVMEVMSPARMLQFEVDACATPTMKRAAINFDFFKQNNFDEYFNDEDECKEEKEEKECKAEAYKDPNPNDKAFAEAAVIVKAKDTVRHEIGYGK